MVADCRGVGQAKINKLTDDELLDIFDFYLKDTQGVDQWHTLVHVCRRWRNIVFASPHRLDLRLRCTENRPVRTALDIWPVLPLEIVYYRVDTWEEQDDVIAALEHHDRVQEITIGVFSNPVWETLVAAMQVPFPELTSLWLWSQGISVPVLPDSFLGGSTPRLQTLTLRGVPFPAMRNLLLSSSDLVHLDLLHLPHSGYISPASMAACLSSLNRLETFLLGFQSPLSRPDRPSPPPQTRVVLPALIILSFEGMVDYSEDLLAHIDTPVLNQLSMRFFMDLVFDIPHLKQLIGRANRLNPPKEATLRFDPRTVTLRLDEELGRVLDLEVMCERIDWQLDSMALLCGQLSPFFSSIERFSLHWDNIPQGTDDMVSTQFLEIFQSFTAIRSLDVSRTLMPFIGRALQEPIGESTTEVLPNLHLLTSEGAATSVSIPEDIQPFIEARQLSGRPVAVHP
jgi:hypothetical protein